MSDAKEHPYFPVLFPLFKQAELKDNEWLEFLGLWKEFEFPKRHLITEAGSVEKYFYAVLKGVQCLYLIDDKGDKRVLGFSFTGSYSGLYDSFMHASPARLTLEALSDSVLIGIDLKTYNDLFDKYPRFDRWGRIIHKDILIGRVEREVELLTLSAKERFQTFMRRCPEELHSIPQKYIASYLNMSPETFSRLYNSVTW